MVDDTLSVKIGGRLVSPALSVVDGQPSTKSIELSFNSSLQNFVKDNIPLESTDGIQTRERVLSRMGVLCRDWIKSVCRKRGLPKEVVDAAGGQLFTAGSYRLGIHEPGADIDTLLVFPSVCTRLDIFGTVSSTDNNEENNNPPRHPDSLSERIRRNIDVTNFVPVENAAVPILTFDWEGVNIDLLFARLNTASVPPDFDIDNDVILDGIDMTTSRTMNATRVTNLIAALVSGTKERYQTFLTVVRCVRKWGKARGLYSNKMGYWGGVNINMAVAFCVQLYPNTCPASLLRKFFLVFKTWRWPRPIILTKPHDAGYGMQVWTKGPQNARQVAPMLTPAYPAMNSTLSVSRQTLQIMHEEFCRGYEIVDRLWKQHQSNKNSDSLDWKELFRPSDFFITYPYYLSLCIVGPSQKDEQMWSGFVESRFRKLVSDMLGKSLPLSKIQLWPKKIEACIADRSALLTMDQRKNSVTFMVGFQVDKLRMRGSQLNIELQMQHFRDWELSKFQPLTPGMDIMTQTFTCKNLPTICFEIYEGGKLGAMKRRRKIRNEDPKRQERRRVNKLAELKAQVAEIQKLKAAAASGGDLVTQTENGEEGDKKRKRLDSEEEGKEVDEIAVVKEEVDEIALVKMEDASPPEVVDNWDNDEGENDGEEDLLENAWDTLQESEAGERKTREDAEADRKKLLSGELLVEGADVPSDDEEELDYTGEDGDGKRSFVVNKSKTRLQPEDHTKMYKDIRALPMREEEAELLRKAGYSVVSDAETESKIIGGNMPNPFRSRNTKVENGDDDDDEEEGRPAINSTKKKSKISIKFRTKFDIVELDAAGHVIDKGDTDFTPSETWTGREAGYEFKLGERGLGYYRTGKKVVVPSNTAY